VDHDKKTLSGRHPHGNETTLLGRVLGVGDSGSERISEDQRGVLERNAVVHKV
jgi:hypothetical protein